ncbi:helix-turn-helix domain-containing protein [Nocardia noduli]|uniref:helix-turn-helix domain-containing protein n=1 Tax=Nocardia noduli TaxID=2815722 RepID=UPI0020B22132|nr:helix-turn-helix domain-containing protein [Nocardia noduli]
MSIAELSEAFALNNSTIHRQTSALLRRGLVERIREPDAGIARKFRITSHGTHLLDHERQQRISALRDALPGWEDDDLARFATYLQRFNTGIEQHRRADRVSRTRK